jgi:uncharacterized protein YjbI with pentapeptide repeats
VPAILKPSKISASLQSEAIEGGGLTTVSAFILFDFSDPLRLLSDQALWPMLAEQMPSGAIFDLGKLKPKGEVIIAGHALAPNDIPVKALRVTARFGSFEKRLAVFGDRFWRLTDRGIEMLEPRPFDMMPIGEKQAFGGTGHKSNPVGKGFRSRQMALAGYDAPMPNVEDVDRLIKSVGDMPPPAHFGPIAPDNPQRIDLLGTYDQHWMKHVSPVKPADFNPLYHCAAPADQRFDAYLTGGETFSISGMSRDGLPVGGQLPELHVRAFVHCPQDDSFTEIKMVCDTATLFPNVQKATMTFRGITKGENRFGDDIGAVMLAVEQTDAEARSVDHYREVFRLRSDPDEAYKHVLSDFQLMPERDVAVVEARRKERWERAEASRAQFQENQDWFVRKSLEDTGLPPDLAPPPDPTQIDDMPLVGIPTSEELESGEFDIAELIDEIEALGDHLQHKADREFASAELQRRAIVATTPEELLPDVARRPLADDDQIARFPDITVDPNIAAALFGIGDQLAGGRQQILSDLKGTVDTEGVQSLQAEIDKAFDQMKAPAKSDEETIKEQFHAARARALRLPEASLLYEARETLNTILPDAINSLPSVDDVIASLPDEMNELAGPIADKMQAPQTVHHAVSDDLFAFPDSVDGLSVDTSAANEALGAAEDCIRGNLPHLIEDGMQGKPLAGLMTKLQKIKPPDGPDCSLPLDRRIDNIQNDALTSLEAAEPEIEDTLATGRRLSPVPLFPLEPLLPAVSERLGTFVAQKLAEKHSFKGADLAGARLRDLDFSGLDLAGTFFEQADLTGANFAGCNLDGAAFTASILEGADLSDCNLHNANFCEADLRGARLEKACLRNSTLVKTGMADVVAHGMTLTDVNLIECSIDRAELNGSSIAGVQFVKCSASGLKLADASIERTVFLSIPLLAANFARSCLRRTVFLEVEATGADFSSTNMSGVSFLGKCDLTDASFQEACAEETCWSTAILEEVSFKKASCNSCLFNECNMIATDFRAASLKNSRVLKSDLSDSDLFAANLYAASLTQSNLRRASMRSANLYCADLLDAKIASCDLTGANLGRTLLEQPANA